MAEKTPNWTPYRFSFNNPLSYKDPNGLFETRRDARIYRNHNKIKGKIIRNNDDTYSILDIENSIEYTGGDDSQYTSSDIHGNDGVIESILVMSSKKSYSNAIFELGSTGVDILENLKWNKMSTAQKSKFIWDLSSKLKSKIGYKLPGNTSSWYRTKIPRVFKLIGIGTGVISAGIIVEDILERNQIRASHLLDSGVTGASFIPGYGWIIGGVYLGLDLVTTGLTGQSIGDHLDNSLEDTLGIDDGVLIKLSQ